MSGDTLALSDADFGFGAAGTLTDANNYFETATSISGAAQNLSGGAAGAAIVVVGAATGTAGTAIYYTEDASNVTAANSYQIADATGLNTGDIQATDFTLRN